MPKPSSASKTFLIKNFSPQYKEKIIVAPSKKVSLQSLLLETKSEQLFLRSLAEAKQEYRKIKKELNPVFEKRKKENIDKFNDYLSLEKTSVNNLLDFLINNDLNLKKIKRMIESRTKYSSSLKLNTAQEFYVKFLNLALRKSDQLLYYLKEMKAIYNLSKSKELPKIYADKISELNSRLKKLSPKRRYLLEDKKNSVDFLKNILPNLKADYRLKAAGEGKDILDYEIYHENLIKKIDSELRSIESKTSELNTRIEELTKQGHEANIRSFISLERKKIPVLKEKFKERFPDFITLYQIFMEERKSIEEKYYIDLYLSDRLSDIK